MVVAARLSVPAAILMVEPEELKRPAIALVLPFWSVMVLVPKILINGLAAKSPAAMEVTVNPFSIKTASPAAGMQLQLVPPEVKDQVLVSVQLPEARL